MRPLIEQAVGKEVALIDTGAAVAKYLQKRLQELGLLSESQKAANLVFYTNSNAENAKQVISQLWGQSAEVKRL